ncbi:hypothetical protein ACRS4M_10580 [Streptococcus pneumoniae]
MNKKVALSLLSATVFASMAASAFAAPKAGVYMGGEVDRYYALTDLFKLNNQGLAKFQSDLTKAGFDNIVFVDTDKKGAFLKDFLTSNEDYEKIKRDLKQSDFEGAYTQANIDGTDGESYDPRKDITPEPTGELKVESVSAINASQIKIVFSQKVNETSAESPANVTFDGFTATGYELQDDGKTLIVTTTTPITKKKDVVVTVKNVTLADDNSVVVPTFTKVITVEDKTPADVTKVESTTNSETASTVDIYFSEPVKSGVVKINGQQVAATFTGSPEKITVSGLKLDATKTHTLEIVNLTDTADNKATVKKSFTVTADANAPQVATLAQYSDKAVLVTFDKKMNATTINGNVTIADELLNPVTPGTVVALPGDTTGTKFIVPVTGTLYGTKSSVTLNLAFNDSITDALGNKVVPSTKQVTLTKDVSAPAVDKVTVKKDNTGKVVSLVLDFNEPLKAGTYPSNKITVINQDGVDVTTDLLADSTGVKFATNSEAVAPGDKKVEFKLTAATNLTGEFTFTFAKGLVQDDAETANDSVAYTKVINFGDAQAPEFEITDADVTSAGTNKIQIAFGRAVKGGNVAGSATALANYTLNGSALPEGTTITLNTAKDTALITLPASSIPTSDTAAVFTVDNVQSLSGLTIKPLTTTVAIVDNVAPVLTSAKVLDNKTIELTYSENIAALSSANVFDSFKIVNGTTAIPLASGELVADSVSGFDTKVKITINKPGTPDTGTPGTTLDLTKAITVETKATTVVKDTVGNTQKAAVTVSVSK